MRLFLIRHGETVDNVAHVYAGSRDSGLTNHGHQQATRLGLHFKCLGLSFTHIFSSHLQRAFKTASLIREAQLPALNDLGPSSTIPEIVQLPILMEQDFGFYEGKKWYERIADSKLTGKEQHREEQDTSGFVDIESKDSMAQRMDTFLDMHLLPLFDSSTNPNSHVVAIVSHGIILSILWKRLLLRLPPKSVAFSLESLANTRGFSLEHLGGWSNTGYLELHMQKTATQASSPTQRPNSGTPALKSASESSKNDAAGTKGEIVDLDAEKVTVGDGLIGEQQVMDVDAKSTQSAFRSSPTKLTYEWTTIIQTVNGRDHLKGLKRTGGGVGSARHDTSQKCIDNFFKRRKIE
ncbi:phosphoglycerate mutase-like protein [Zopfia rhizophila CBS 207.26]|uniref:Phosphoglycerate mutase-like protein n=1 Tax=Zopfia rhizophila CBS 207.26 TaxID=1314779 RepID=A0A6A6EGN1_9PEZI|nr:phosphoglycerate mutase-like protein [Zopfia rhizophila CBS 207.26]